MATRKWYEVQPTAAAVAPQPTPYAPSTAEQYISASRQTQDEVMLGKYNRGEIGWQDYQKYLIDRQTLPEAGLAEPYRETENAMLGTERQNELQRLIDVMSRTSEYAGLTPEQVVAGVKSGTTVKGAPALATEQNIRDYIGSLLGGTNPLAKGMTGSEKEAFTQNLAEFNQNIREGDMAQLYKDYAYGYLSAPQYLAKVAGITDISTGNPQNMMRGEAANLEDTYYYPVKSSYLRQKAIIESGSDPNKYLSATKNMMNYFAPYTPDWNYFSNENQNAAAERYKDWTARWNWNRNAQPEQWSYDVYKGKMSNEDYTNKMWGYNQQGWKYNYGMPDYKYNEWSTVNTLPKWTSNF